MASPFATCFSNLSYKDNSGKPLDIDITGNDMNCAILENPQRFNAKLANFSQAEKDAVYSCIADKVKNNKQLCCELGNYRCNPEKYSSCTGVNCGTDDIKRDNNDPGKNCEKCENPFQYCSNDQLDASYENSSIIQSCCGSETDQSQLGQFNNSCDIFFNNYVLDTSTNDRDGQKPFCADEANNPIYAAACKYCMNAPNINECSVKYINQILEDDPDQLENLCTSIDISDVGLGTTNASTCGDCGLGRGCFLCRYCNKCGAYNSELCKGVVHSPEKPLDNNVTGKGEADSKTDKKKGLSNIDIALIVIGSLLALSIIIYIYKSRKN